MATITQLRTELERDLRASLEVGALAWSICQSDRALASRPIPAQFSDLHPDERRTYQDKAIETLMSLNLEADLYAQMQGDIAAWDFFVQFCKDHGLDWLDVDHPINQGDKVEVLVVAMTKNAIKRYKHTLSGMYPGLSRHLVRQERLRTTDTDPDLREGA